jgi:predicted esterase
MTLSTVLRPRSVFLALGVFAALWFGAAVAHAQDDDGEDDDDEAEAKFAKLEREIGALFEQKKYAEAAEKCRAEIALVPKAPGPQYNLACALARMGKTAEALESLGKSVELGFDDSEHMGVDEDLASLHGEKAFGELVAKVRDRLYDPGVDVPEVKTVEASPEGGLRYRLLLSKDATAEKPQRLLVWLHPSGGSMNKTVDAMAAQWTKAGWALLVPVQKGWAGWTDVDAAKLLVKTLPDVAKTPGVDVKKPVLLGFSAGGQMALQLWEKEPAKFGGLVLDAAYPIDMDAYRENQVALAKATPAGEAVKGVPIFVLVGDKDGAHVVWKQAEEPWRKAGVPLTIEYVAGGKHAWLFGKSQTEALDAWLRDVAAGKAPGKADAAGPIVDPPADAPK